MNTFLKRLFAIAAMATIISPSGLAAELSGEDVHVEASYSSHQSHPHHLGVFVGGATRLEDDGHDETGMVIGLDYEYRFAPEWGVGVVAEQVVLADDHRDLAIAIPLVWHPVSALSVGVGPGFETDGSHREFLVRLSVAYGFHVRKFTITPGIAIDLANSANTVVYGISIGRGF